MRRRKLRLPSSSDEDDEAPSHQTLSILNPSDRLDSNAPLDISEDEFVDVADELSDHSPPAASGQTSALPSDRMEVSAGDPSNASVGPIDEFLRRVGLVLRREWMASCLSNFSGAVHGFESLDLAEKARLCFEEFLFSDMNYSGSGILPENVHSMHDVELEGPFVLQVDEIANISSPLRERYHDSPPGLKRCLKLSLTDGVQRVFGLEYRPVSIMENLSPAGMKIVIRNVKVRRGLLLLLPEILVVLGGMVDSLQAACQRVVSEVNKPPRGKRKQAVIALCQRATCAAWPSNTSNVNEPNTSASANNFDNNCPQPNVSMPRNLSNTLSMDGVVSVNANDFIGQPTVNEHSDHGTIDMEELVARNSRSDTSNGFDVSHARESLIEQPVYSTESSMDDNAAGPRERTSFMDLDDAKNEATHLVILTGDEEIPFTYLACLLAKWNTEKDSAPFIQGRIKCVFTGVKSFQFKDKSKYELIIYVDDGSYIAEVLIDHNVVQKAIGFSTEDVTIALSSPDKKTKADMVEIMKKFQLFLSKFEGTMTLEINKESSYPVGLEMSQGCSSSDAWLLLRRLKCFSSRNLQHQTADLIVLSP
ncbi:hypothetical protein AXF42_Ash009564 [Apostasia shenzhenica]|uniref:RecQ-mediated genome instability protein 1 n=1 Tax=Apostasia shenzhenica TaxID=1088818 RepID=A0A2I0B975_9ASPA|nr:hypothetical protein AXF42_Ash009564 [Apostasia shenzhenica]